MTKCKVLCIISLFFLEKKSEIWNACTLFEKWKVNLVFLSLFSRMKSEMKMHWDRDREWKVKWKCLEIEIEKWNFQKNLENSRETRLSQVTVSLYFSQVFNQISPKLLTVFLTTRLQYFLNYLVVGGCSGHAAWAPWGRDGRRQEAQRAYN